MKISFLGMNKDDTNNFFDMLRTNLEFATDINNYQNSIGVDISVKHLFDEHNYQIAKLIIWNISTDSFFKWVRPLFYNGSIGAIILHSENTEQGINKTKSIIMEFEKFEFSKYLIILTDPREDENNNIINELIEFSNEYNFNVELFERLDYQNKNRYGNKENNFWNELRFFYETIIINLFTNAVKNTPGNKFEIEKFKTNYFQNLRKFEKSIEKIYELLDKIGLEHDNTYIYIRHNIGLFTINIFNATCYYHFPNSTHKKYICMINETKEFQGWSNLEFVSPNLFLAIAKAFYLLDGHYDSVVQKQLNEIKRVLKQKY